MAGADSTQLSVGLERVAKVIARAGVCSRREAEALIEEGRVRVNGAVIQSPALDIASSDKVEVDGAILPAREAPRLWRYNKPKGRVTTHKDPEGRPTVFEALPDNLPRVVSVGRLDFNTEGLLLLTNDGELARHMELPSTGWARRYRVRAYGTIEQEALDALADGLTVEGVNYGPIEASVERDQGDNVWIALLIREGKNREVRRIMEHLGLTVNRLIRVSFGPFILGDLEPGQVEEVKTRMLQDQLGPRLTRQLGVKREPMREERALAPKRGKPTYLRRKTSPDDNRPLMQAEPEREPRQRRIVPWDGASGEPVRVETIVEKPRRPRRDEGDRPARGQNARGERDGGRERSAPRAEFSRDRPRPHTPDRKTFGDRNGGAGSRPVRAERPPFVRDREREGGPGNGANRTEFSRSGDRPRDGGGERAFRDRPPRENGARSERPSRPTFKRDGGFQTDRKDFRPRTYGDGDRSAAADRGPAVKRDGWTPRVSPPEGDERPARESYGDRGPRPARAWAERPRRAEGGDTSPRPNSGRDAPFRARPTGDRPFKSQPRSSEGKFERRADGDRPAPRTGSRDFSDRPRRPAADRSFSAPDRGAATDGRDNRSEGSPKPFMKRETSNRSGYDTRKGFGRSDSVRPPSRERDHSGASETPDNARGEAWKRDKPRFASASSNESGRPPRENAGNNRGRTFRTSTETGEAPRRPREDRSTSSAGGGFKGRPRTGSASGGPRKPWAGSSARSAKGGQDRSRSAGDRPGRDAHSGAKPFVARDRGSRAGDSSRPRPAPRKKPEGETDDA